MVSKMETRALGLPSGGQGLAGKAAVCAYCTQPSAALGRGGKGDVVFHGQRLFKEELAKNWREKSVPDTGNSKM